MLTCIPCYQGLHYACINHYGLRNDKYCLCDTCCQIKKDVEDDMIEQSETEE